MKGIKTKRQTPIGNRLFELRKESRMTREQFAARYGVSVGFIGDIETGKYKVSNKTVRRLCTIFGDSLFVEFIENRNCIVCGEEFEPVTKEKFCCKEHAVLHNRNEFRIRPPKPKGWKKRTNMTPLALDNYEARACGLSYGIWRTHQMGWV